MFQQKTKEWQNQMTKKLSSKVNVHFGGEDKGRVVIHFDSLDEMGWLMQHLKVEK